MADEYFFAKGDKHFGPFTAAQLKKLAEAGRLQPTDKVRKSGMPNWVPVAAVKGLFAATPAPPSPASEAEPEPVAAVEEIDDIAEAIVVEEEEGAPLVEAEHLSADLEEEVVPVRRRPPRASGDLVGALLHLVRNPVGHCAEAYAQMGKTNALIVGIVGGVLFDVCLMLGLVILFLRYSNFAVPAPRGEFGPMPKSIDTSFPWKLFFQYSLAGLFPPIGFIVGIIACRNLFRGSESFASDVFIGGVAVLPLALVFVIAPLLGVGNLEIISFLLLFMVCLTILWLFAGCTKIQRLSEGATTVAIPLVFVASAWITKMLIAALA